MRKYIVVALSVGAMSNKIFKADDIVNEDAWEPGRAEELEKQGFIKEYTGKKTVAQDAGSEIQLPPLDPQLGDHATNEQEIGLPETKPDNKKTNSKK